MNQNCGIYRISCLQNGKFYIGSSNNIRARFNKHKNELRKNIHSNIHLQRSWNKYGKENFIFEIIELVELDFLLEREQYWLDQTRCYDELIGFNLCNRVGAGPKCIKKWIVTTPNDVEIEVFDLSAFCRENNLIISNMAAVARGTRASHKGYKCRHYNISKEEWLKSINSKCKNTESSTIRWIVVFPDGKEIEVSSLSNFCREYNLSQSSMMQILKGRRKHTKGFSCKRIETKNKFKYGITFPDSQYIIVDNLKEFCIMNNLDESAMHGVASGKYSHHKSYKCQRLFVAQDIDQPTLQPNLKDYILGS